MSIHPGFSAGIIAGHSLGGSASAELRKFGQQEGDHLRVKGQPHRAAVVDHQSGRVALDVDGGVGAEAVAIAQSDFACRAASGVGVVFAARSAPSADHSAVQKTPTAAITASGVGV